METVDVRAARIARSQRGRISRRQLLDEAGVSASTVTARVHRGTWTEPYPNVIDLGTHARSWRGDLVAAVLSADPVAWASHASAAHLLGFLDAPRPPRPQVLVPRGRHAAIGGLRLHTTRAIGADEVTRVHAIACTGAARTLLDLAASTGPDQLERYLADATRRDAQLPARVVELADRHRCVNGRRRLLDVVGRLPGDAARLGSPLEVLGVQRLRQLGAPQFVLQHQIRDPDGAAVKQVDVAWPAQRVLLEFDGAAYHDVTSAREHDAVVRSRLTAIGWRVVVVRRADLDGPLLEELVRSLR